MFTFEESVADELEPPCYNVDDDDGIAHFGGFVVLEEPVPGQCAQDNDHSHNSLYDRSHQYCSSNPNCEIV